MMTKTGKEKTYLRSKNENNEHKKENRKLHSRKISKERQNTQRMLPAYGLFTLTDAMKVVS